MRKLSTEAKTLTAILATLVIVVLIYLLTTDSTPLKNWATGIMGGK
jgi:hypothetical protein